MSHESISEAASNTTYAGAALSAGAAVPHYVFGLTLDEWSVLGIIFGMVMAFFGWLTNVYFKRQHSQAIADAIESGKITVVSDE
jgi:VIT1/CCC1 family predicted Fe2+/Mn2+ transporter